MWEKRMRVLDCKVIVNSDFGLSGNVVIYLAHVLVTDIEQHAKEMISMITDTSWLNTLGVIEKKSFEARANPTIQRMVEGILSKIEDVITEEFGEYLVTNCAQNLLESSLGHKKVPIAELLKEKISGNPGFDFHTESHSGYVAFGESKYSGSSNPYSEALSQINDFIDKEKDEMEFTIIQHFVSKEAIDNAVSGQKAYVAAFSINAKNPSIILKHALTCQHTVKLTSHKELYLIGVEIA